MSWFHPKKFRTSPAKLKSVQYILRQAREFPVRNVNKVLKRVAPGATDDTDPYFYKTLNLTFFVDDPYQASRECSVVIDKCLAHDHNEAHYIEGILQGFYSDNLDDGLLHLRKSADGMYGPAIVLYGVLMLCLGNTNEGKKYIDKLEWKTRRNRVDRSWSTVKRSLRRVNIVFTGRYQRNLQRLEPPESCHVNDMDNYCELCVYYKQIKKFIAIV